MNRISLAISAPTLSLAMIASPALAQDRTPSLAPTDTMYLLHVPSFATFAEHYEDSALHALYAEPAIRAILDDALEGTWKGIDGMLDTLGHERDDLTPPTGELGLAFWLVMPEPEEHADDEDFYFNYEPPESHFLAYAQFGENAEAWRDLTSAWTDHLAKDRDAYRIDEEDFAGRTIVSVVPLEWEQAQNEDENADDEMGDDEWNEEDWDEEDWNEDDAGPLDPSDYLEPEHPLYFAWVDDDLVVSTDMDRLERAIESLGGKDIDSLADSDDFARARSMLPRNADAHAVLMLDKVWEPFLQNMGFMFAMMMGDADPEAMLDALGLSGARALAAGVTLAPDQSALRVDAALLAPERRGLLSLVDFPAASIDPPDWVGESASSYGVFRVHFDRVIPLIRDVIARLPEDQRAQAEFGFNQFTALAGPVLETLGPEVYSAGRIVRPLSATSSQSLYVIPVKDELIVRNVMQLGAQSMGLEARDFEGATIYSGEYFPVALGLGYGRAFIGAAPAVEDAMRSAANPGNAPLARSDRWRNAAQFIDRDATGASWMDVVEAFEISAWSVKNQRALIEEQLSQVPDIDEDTKKSILENYETPEWAEKFPAPAVWRRHIGDLTYDFRWGSGGLRSTINLLKPADD
ncbi:MAG: hypothetical protein RBS39_03730 [Phycisphaerales bacterium]|jgi:hypothetical protein|nr:hypothetical protein [Phycisphaerales bacterium]